jgi:hypothetical protein
MGRLKTVIYVTATLTILLSLTYFLDVLVLKAHISELLPVAATMMIIDAGLGLMLMKKAVVPSGSYYLLFPKALETAIHSIPARRNTRP